MTPSSRQSYRNSEFFGEEDSSSACISKDEQDEMTAGDFLRAIPFGYCKCGCGQKTTVSPKNCTMHGWIKGVPKNFIRGHKSKPYAEYAMPFKINGVYCRFIALTQGQFAIVEEQDYYPLMRFKWWAHFCPDTGTYYAVGSRFVDGVWIRRPMAAEILGLPRGVIADHKNHETLLNIRGNLRASDKHENRRNSFSTPHSTPYKGVSKQIGTRSVKAQITVAGVKHYLGMFKSEKAAAAAYAHAAHVLHGEFACAK